MAIEKIPFPASVPAAVSDYQKQNALLAALVKAVDGAQKIVGGNVVQGAVFNVGGTLYVATSDTAITGVASDYVKLTPSGDTLTLAPSYVASLSGVTWNAEYKGYYDGSGNLYESTRLERHGRKVFLSNDTFIVPEGISTIFISGCGKGGNGGDGGAGYEVALGVGGSGGGGGGGAYAVKRPVSVSPGESHAITIDGSKSSFGALLVLPAGSNGGNGGNATSGGGGSSGAGGSPGGGAATVSGYGFWGGVGISGGGGCESLFQYGPGGDGAAIVGGLHQNGNNGSPGSGYGSGGGGGSGGYGGGYSGGSGGAGGPGIIIIEW